MKKNFFPLLIILGFLIPNSSFTQYYKWLQIDGGPGIQDNVDFEIDSLGNYYFCGWSNGNHELGGNLYSNPLARYTGFVAKYDSARNFVWMKNIKTSETSNFHIRPRDLEIGPDGNILLLAWSEDSTICFDTTCIYPSLGLALYKFNPDGDLIWGRTIANGYSRWDGGFVETDNEGNIIVFFPSQNNVNIDGTQFNTEPVYGDLIVAKFDSLGGLIWGQVIGATLSNENARSLSTGPNSDILISGIFFEELDFQGDTLDPTGRYDDFVFLLDSAGNLKKSFHVGGPHNDNAIAKFDLQNDGFWIVGSHLISGNFQGPGYIESDTCYVSNMFVSKWDSLGNKVLWDTIGYDGYVNDFTLRDSSLYFYSSYSFGNSQYQPPQIFLPNLKGGMISKFDPNNRFEWVSHITNPTSDNFYGRRIKRSIDNRLLFSFQKTTDLQAGFNFVPFAPTDNDIGFGEIEDWGYYHQLSGYIYFDQNQNGMREATEPLFGHYPVWDTLRNIRTFSDTSGKYVLQLQGSQYQLDCFPPRYFTSTGVSSYNVQLSGSQQILDTLNFGFYAPPSLQDLSISLTNLNTPSPGFTFGQGINYSYYGIDTIDAHIFLVFDTNRVDLVSTSTPIDSVVGDTIIFSHQGLLPLESGFIYLLFQARTTNNMGDSLLTFAGITPVTSDTFPDDNLDSLFQIFTSSYDPNDKTVIPKGEGPFGRISPDEKLDYIIRFQNTGNDTAHFVIITDTLSPYLDWNSIENLQASHPFSVRQSLDSILIFEFLQIELPDSTTNPIGSQGFIRFQVNQLPNLQDGTTIENSAAIYFDYNVPIITNTVSNLIDRCVLLDFSIQTTDISCFGLNDGKVIIENLSGHSPFQIDWGGIDTTHLFPGTYSVFITDSLNCIDSTDYNINQPDSISVVLQITDELCFGDSSGTVSANISGGTLPYNLNWNGVDTTSLSSGIFFLAIQDNNNCQDTVHYTISSPPPITISAFGFDETGTNQDGMAYLTLTGGTPPHSIIWNTGETTDTIYDLEGNRNYIAHITDANGCTDSIVVHIGRLMSKPQQLDQQGSVQVYPNPSPGNFRIDLGKVFAQISLEVLDDRGRLILREDYQQRNFLEVDLSREADGPYLLHLKSESGSATLRVVKRK